MKRLKIEVPLVVELEFQTEFDLDDEDLFGVTTKIADALNELVCGDIISGAKAHPSFDEYIKNLNVFIGENIEVSAD